MELIIAAILPTISLSIIAIYSETLAFFSAGLISELKIFISSLIIGGTQYFESLYNLRPFYEFLIWGQNGIFFWKNWAKFLEFRGHFWTKNHRAQFLDLS